MRKLMAAAAVAASLTGGAAAGVALFTPTLATAQSDGQEAPAEEQQQSREAPHSMNDALAPLVQNNTITQAQADAVLDAIVEARPERGPGGPGRRHGRFLEPAAEALGIEVAELRTALRNGQTIAQVAQARNVPVQTVINALVGDLREHLAQAVANGRITQAEADEKLANAEERFTALVNGQRPPRPGGPEATAA